MLWQECRQGEGVVEGVGCRLVQRGWAERLLWEPALCKLDAPLFTTVRPSRQAGTPHSPLCPALPACSWRISGCAYGASTRRAT